MYNYVELLISEIFLLMQASGQQHLGVKLRKGIVKISWNATATRHRTLEYLL